MKKIIVLLLVALGAQTFSQEQINWLPFEKAMTLNKENPKPILIDVYTDWCGYCKKMDKTTYTNQVIVNYINQYFYAIKLDGEGKKDITYRGYTFKYKKDRGTKYHELSASLLDGKLAYPTTLFMSKKEEVLQKIPGYLSKERFEKILAFFNEKAYETENWEAFEKNFKSNL